MNARDESPQILDYARPMPRGGRPVRDRVPFAGVAALFLPVALLILSVGVSGLFDGLRTEPHYFQRPLWLRDGGVATTAGPALLYFATRVSLIRPDPTPRRRALCRAIDVTGLALSLLLTGLSGWLVVGMHWGDLTASEKDVAGAVSQSAAASAVVVAGMSAALLWLNRRRSRRQRPADQNPSSVSDSRSAGR